MRDIIHLNIDIRRTRESHNAAQNPMQLQMSPGMKWMECAAVVILKSSPLLIGWPAEGLQSAKSRRATLLSAEFVGHPEGTDIDISTIWSLCLGNCSDANRNV